MHSTVSRALQKCQPRSAVGVGGGRLRRPWSLGYLSARHTRSDRPRVADKVTNKYVFCPKNIIFLQNILLFGETRPQNSIFPSPLQKIRSPHLFFLQVCSPVRRALSTPRGGARAPQAQFCLIQEEIRFPAEISDLSGFVREPASIIVRSRILWIPDLSSKPDGSGPRSQEPKSPEALCWFANASATVVARH